MDIILALIHLVSFALALAFGALVGYYMAHTRSESIIKMLKDENSFLSSENDALQKRLNRANFTTLSIKHD